LKPASDIPAIAQRRRAVQMLMFCTLLWALSFPAMKALAQTQQQLLPQTGSWFFTALSVTYRFGLAGLLLLPFVFRQLRADGQLVFYRAQRDVPVRPGGFAFAAVCVPPTPNAPLA
jgi:drug/metabolite transporter (DMT)-like permease